MADNRELLLKLPDLSTGIVHGVAALYPCRRSSRHPAVADRCTLESVGRDSLLDDQIRMLIAAGCLIGGIGIHFNGDVNVAIGMVLWLALAATIGFMLPYGWMILVAPIPWLVGVGGGVLIGQHEGLGEAWALPLVLSTLAGVFGIIFGAAARRNNNRTGRQDSD